jgi:hypothetical protein
MAYLNPVDQVRGLRAALAGLAAQDTPADEDDVDAA